MQIILMEKVQKLGDLGDLVKVKDGYARNYLIPQKKARRATPAALQEFEARRAELEKAAADKLEAAREFAAKLEGIVVTLARKAGVDGRLFGSVTNHDIAEGLEAQGFEIEKSAIYMPSGGPLKTLGEVSLEIALHTDVRATIQVAVVPEQ
jgi:large subunit ribosomal protein L9